ncbi:TadE/TadG family type IV pilus assembly protein [Aromatoleum evansii]|uniref:TadE/TadG family type IV pilus assembly protein n=1 Tax=Aromatoleum evansii TaxID=59406 RepID=UPI00145CFAAF|nr:TadE/TadG family type IV pilus assembly protein [Aromatoleum evansii]NMG28610.1 pilus assembly protein [Aromatoleum evansii]
MKTRVLRAANQQSGVAAVEFAIVALVFFTLLIGIMEMGRLLWTWNAAVEATRLGARLAIVCSMGDGDITSRMRGMLPSLTDANIDIDYLNPPFEDNTCTVDSCKAVRVSLTGYTHVTVIPLVPLSLPIPQFQTTLPREGMNSTGNPVCS